MKDFRGFITNKIKVEITEIEKRTDLSDHEKVAQVIKIASSTCAIVAIQPIPFADIYLLTPIQAYFGSRIASIRGVPVNESDVLDLIKEVLGVIGLGVIAQQIGLAVWKVVTGGIGGLLTLPMVYALTYAVMTVIDEHYMAKVKNRKLSDDVIKDIWKKAFRKGKKEKQDLEKSELMKQGTNHKKTIKFKNIK